MTRVLGSLALLLCCLVGCGSIGSHAGRPGDAPSSAASAQAAQDMDAYYLSTCPLCGRLLGSRGDAIEITHHGRSVRVCTAECAARFDADPANAILTVDIQLIADQRPFYPTTRSIIDSQPLGDRPIEFIWGNRLFVARDAADRDAVLRDPSAAMRTLNRLVVEHQRHGYGMPDTCPVQGVILPNESRIDIVVANRMIRVCCARCARVVRARPYQYIAMVDFANREARRREQPGTGNRP